MALLPLWEMIEESYERIQIDPRAGYDYRTARRSLDLLQKEWANRGVHLWTIVTRNYPALKGVKEITIDAVAHDVMDAVVRDTSVTPPFDTALNRVSLTDWLTGTPFKDMPGRPTRYSVRRLATSVIVMPWPIPDRDYVVVINQMEIIKGATGFMGVPVIPERFEGAMIAGLAYYLAQKKNVKRLAETRMLYEEEFQRAFNEDRDRASVFMSPEIGRV
jgi:hypothetical protein